MSTYLIKNAVEELGKAFHEFKEANDSRLSNLEKSADDTLVTQKISRLNAALDGAQEKLQNLSLMARRPSFPNSSSGEGETVNKAFSDFLKTGNDSAMRNLPLCAKTLTGKRPEDGGYFLPQNITGEIHSALTRYSIMREVSRVVQVSRHEYEVIVSSDQSPNILWSDDENPGEESKQPALARIAIPVCQMYQRICVSQNLLDDSAVNIERWIADTAARTMAIEENRSFVNGDGNGQPRGFLTYPVSEKEEAGKLQVIRTGQKGLFPQANSEEALLNLFNSLAPEYLHDAVWVMPRSTLAAVRGMKNTSGNYLWQPPLSADLKNASLLGFPVVVMDDMPALEKGKETISAAFGNFKEGYTIADREGMVIIRDHLTKKPLIEFLLHRRVGAGVIDFRAIKLLGFY